MNISNYRIFQILSRHFVWTKFFLVLSILFFGSCKKESDIGLGVQPEGDLINLVVTDTTTLVTFTVAEDSIRSDESTVIQLGSYDDVDFGNVTASLYTQFLIPTGQSNVDFGASAIADSCFIYLAYEYDFYGDTTMPQTLDVYQLTDDLHADSSYYSNQTKTAPTLVGSVTFDPHPRMNVADNGDTLPPFLKIPISASLGTAITTGTGSGLIPGNTELLNIFKGFYIVPSGPVGGSLLRFLPKDTLSKFKIYYHNSTTSNLSYSLLVTSSAAYFSHFTHDYSSTPLIQAQLTAPGVGYDLVYLQSASGLKVKIEFPFLDDYKNLGYPIAINKAELVMKIDPVYSTANLPANKQLYMVYPDSAGAQYLVPDMFLESLSYFGGALNTTANEYRINLAHYFQDMMNGELDNTGIFLKEIAGVEQGRRVVLGGGTINAAPYRMYLHLVYTQIN
jgi:hypothetical protein